MPTHFLVVLNKFKICPELMIKIKGYDKNGLVTCTSNTLFNCSMGTFTSGNEFEAGNEWNAVQLQKEGEFYQNLIIAAVLWHCTSTLQSKCTVLCKQSSIFVWAERLAVEVIHMCMYAEEIERWLFTLYIWYVTV